MKLTKHCEERKRQRGFFDFALKVILEHGHMDRAANGATRISFSNKQYQATVSDLKKVIQSLDKAKGGNLVMMNGYVLTVYKKRISAIKHTQPLGALPKFIE